MIAGSKICWHLGNGEKPVTADIFLTDYCNNACPYCAYARYGERNGEYMPFEKFVEYVERMRHGLGVQGFILTGGGEPTINPDFDRITAFLEDSGIHYGINSNFNVYRDCNPDFLKVSLDGYDKESYKERRRVDGYDKTIENIKRFRKEHPQTRLGLQMLATDSEEVTKFHDAHAGLDVDYMVFRPVESCGGKYYDDYLKQYERYTVVSTVKMLAILDPRVVLNYKFDHIGESVSDCPAHWSQLAINQRGEVLYCCHKPQEIVCHIMDKDILEKHRNAHHNAESCDIPCRLSGANAVLRELGKVDERMFI